LSNEIANLEKVLLSVIDVVQIGGHGVVLLGLLDVLLESNFEILIWVVSLKCC
jgi:hypothetical protein